jgi:transposase
MSLIPATPSRGKMRLMIKDKSGVSAAVFIAFLQRLIAGARGVIFLIVDRGPAHAAKKTRAFGERVKGSLRLFYRPPFSPDRNPDALVWKHRKADTVRRRAVSSKDDFESKARSSMRQRQPPGQNPLPLSITFPPIGRANGQLLMNCLIDGLILPMRGHVDKIR